VTLWRVKIDTLNDNRIIHIQHSKGLQHMQSQGTCKVHNGAPLERENKGLINPKALASRSRCPCFKFHPLPSHPKKKFDIFDIQ